jgi:hypothetical protein
MVSLCSTGWPGTCGPPECWNYRQVLPCLASDHSVMLGCEATLCVVGCLQHLWDGLPGASCAQVTMAQGIPIVHIPLVWWSILTHPGKKHDI